MPQLDVSTYTSQLFWLVLSFASLYLFTAKVTIPRIAKILESRWQRIEGSIKRADELKYQGDKVKVDYEKDLEKAREQAHDHVMKMINKVTVNGTQRRKDIANMMVARIQSAEAHIEEQKVQALGDVKAIAESVAASAVEKLTEQKVAPATIEKVLNQLIQQKVA